MSEAPLDKLTRDIDYEFSYNAKPDRKNILPRGRTMRMATGTSMTPEQYFIESDRRYMRLLAGPGAGKSYNLKERLKRIADGSGRILVATFTSVAAQDLRKDIEVLGSKIGKDRVEKIEVSTLHALALRLLSQEKLPFRIMQKFEVNTMLWDLEPDIGKFRRKEALFKRWKAQNDILDANDDEQLFMKSMSEWLSAHGGSVLDDAIPRICQYLTDHEDARKRLSYSHVLVDEYQDLNPVEQRFVELLTAEDGHLTVIGDDDQSIYGFKGASPAGIRDFVKNHTDCDDVRFAECRRCPTVVVEMANRIISRSKDRIDKTLIAMPDKQRGYFSRMSFPTPEAEINGLCALIRDKGAKLKWEEIVVLSPIRERGKALFKALRDAGIPAAFCYRDEMLTGKAVQYNFALLTLAANPEDRVAWRFLLGFKGDKRRTPGYSRIRKYAEEKGMDMLDVLEQCSLQKIKIPYSRDIIRQYREVKEELFRVKADSGRLFELLGDGEPEYAAILKRALVRIPGNFTDALSDVLEEVYSPEASAKSGRVRVMSLHASKGLSAEMIVIMSAVEGLIPLESARNVEEQRRLFYVAITRCKGHPMNKYPGELVISAYEHSDDGSKVYEISPFFQQIKDLTT